MDVMEALLGFALLTAGLQQNFNSPAIDGSLFSKSSKPVAATSATVRLVESSLSIVFHPGADYPNVQFPTPDGGWNLSAFGAVQITVANKGKVDAPVFLRVDNPGDWHNSPWDTGSAVVPPGQTKVLRCAFGQGGYKLNAAHVTGIQVFVIKPSSPITVELSGLKASGSPTDRVVGDAFSSPADMLKPAVVPIWLGQRPPVPGAWVRTLNANFDGSKLNDKVWGEKFHWDGLLPDQTEAYSPAEVSLSGGVAHMRFEKKVTHAYGDPSLGSRPYGSSMLCTWGKWTQKYGYFEARMKLPTARGLWPAFWMMPDRGSSFGDGGAREDTSKGGMEFDILEHLTEWGPGRYNVAVHWDGYQTDHKSWGNANTYYGPTKEGWHTWGLLWEPGKLVWYCDGVKKAEFASSRVGSVPMYIILNIQSGGWATKDVDDAKLPDELQVDYVRAWQRKP